MYRRVAMARRLRAHLSPLVVLAAVSLLSLGARVALLGQPCRVNCSKSTDHVLVFDEVYYVNAARVIAGIAPPANEKYGGAPFGDDPNAEHPQLVKLLMAGSIELFGDGPLAWRLASLVLGSVAILGMFALVRAGGGGPWMAVGAAALMAADNLLLVHGRIGTLDVPALAPMLWGVVLYLRGRPLLGGLLIGIASCMKLVAPYALLVVVLLEVLRRGRVHVRGGARVRAAAGLSGRAVRDAAVRVGACFAAAVATFFLSLTILDRIAPPYDPAQGKLLGSSPFRHLAHMLSYGASQSSPHGPTGIASYPWAWLVDSKPITYLNINPARPAPGLYHIHPAAHFIGLINPAVLLLGTPALLVVAWEVVRRWRRPRSADAGADESAVGEVPLVAVAWFVGTFAPFVAIALAFQRTSYLYYMVVVMPGIYMSASYLAWRARRYRRLLAIWWLVVISAAVVLWPFTPLP
jgi:dolichyl-phosphate-mannose--protein O-mannosyl transferase